MPQWIWLNKEEVFCSECHKKCERSWLPVICPECGARMKNGDRFKWEKSDE